MFMITTHASWSQYAIGQLDLNSDIMSWYDQALSVDQSPVLEGTYFKLEGINSKENQYFQNAQWRRGSVTFACQTYSEVELLYNSHKDLLLIKNQALHFSVTQPTLLNQSKVSRFNILDRTFTKLPQSMTKSFEDGYYEILYEGYKIKFYSKRIKNEYVRSGKLVYLPEDRYYAYYNGEWVKYTNKNLLLNWFTEYKTEIKNRSKELYTRPKDDEGKDATELIKYCDQLISNK